MGRRKVLFCRKIHQTQGTYKHTHVHWGDVQKTFFTSQSPLKKERKKNGICSNVFVLVYLFFPFRTFYFSIQRAKKKVIFFEKDFFATRVSECAWCEKLLCAMCATEMARRNIFIRGAIYVRAVGTNTDVRDDDDDEPGSRSRRQGKRETTQNAVYAAEAVDCSSNIWLCTLCDSEKTLFINIVLRYIAEAGNRYTLSRSHSLASFSSSSLYRIKWWIFACPRRLFQKHSAPPRALALASKQQRSALVLGYYYFLVFLAFVAPKKKEK